MRIGLIVAMDRNRLIGRDNALPWRLPADLRHFKRLTLGKPVIMGRRTFESIGRPLPERHNIVITRRAGYAAPGCTVVDSPEAARAAAEGDAAGEIMVIGGTEVFAAFLPLAGRIYLTEIDHAFEGDTHFPALESGVWREVSREAHAPDARNPWPYAFVTLERVGSA